MPRRWLLLFPLLLGACKGPNPSFRAADKATDARADGAKAEVNTSPVDVAGEGAATEADGGHPPDLGGVADLASRADTGGGPDAAVGTDVAGSADLADVREEPTIADLALHWAFEEAAAGGQ